MQRCSQDQNLKVKAWTIKAKAKAGTLKAKATAWTLDAKAEAKTLTPEAKAKAWTFKAKTKPTDWTFKTKAKTKAWTFKAKAKDTTFGLVDPRGQGLALRVLEAKAWPRWLQHGIYTTMPHAAYMQHMFYIHFIWHMTYMKKTDIYASRV